MFMLACVHIPSVTGNLAPQRSIRDYEFLFPFRFLAINLLPVKEFILKLERNIIYDDVDLVPLKQSNLTFYM